MNDVSSVASSRIPTQAHVELIQSRIDVQPKWLLPTEAFDNVKKELRSILDINWGLLHLEQCSRKVVLAMRRAEDRRWTLETQIVR